MSLREYLAKRNFDHTSEPAGKSKSRAKNAGSKHRFVIQKHDASRLHYDFRLELDGTLKSWAVPKGMPYANGEKHLAVQVEDHPLEYATFEGTIPSGQYGGGTVMVWDTGTYKALSAHPAKDLRDGKLHFILHGKKLKGEWALVRIKHGEANQWLLIKSGKSMKPVPKKRDDQSAVSRRTMASIGKNSDAAWNSNSGGKTERLKFIKPMMAKKMEHPPHGNDWIYELKFDGFRALALKLGNDVELLSRNNKPLNRSFPEIADAVKSLPVKYAIFDGEIVALDDEGRSSFQLLQARETGTARPPIFYYLFDLPNLEGKDLRDEPLHIRKELLKKICRAVRDPIRFSAGLAGAPSRILKEVSKRGLEGIIGKKKNSKYESGRRSGAWIKLKCVNEQEFVIGGFTQPGGTRKHLGALLVGYFENKKLRFCGKVGTGFNQETLTELHKQLASLKQTGPPFTTTSRTFAPAELKTTTWVKPQLVCQLKFSEWTDDEKLRQPVFLGLRKDKKPSEVVRERANRTK